MIKLNVRIFFYVAVLVYPTISTLNEIIYRNKLSFGAKLSAIIFVASICLCAAEDLISKTIPDFFNAVIFLSGISFSLFTDNLQGTIMTIFKSIILFVCLAAIFYLSKGGIGGGDIKMAAAASVLIGPMSAVMNICYAALLAAPLCLAVIIFSRTLKTDNGEADNKKARRQMTLPFGPFYAFCILIELNKAF